MEVILLCLIVLSFILVLGMAATKNEEAFINEAQLACSIASLASGSTQESASFNNGGQTIIPFDWHVQLTFTIASGSPATTGPYVNLYVAGTGQGALWPIIQLTAGTTKTLGGNNASVGALSAPNQLVNIGNFAIQTTSSGAERTFRTEPVSVAQGYNGAVPYDFSILVENQMGVAFSTSTVTTGNYLSLTGVYTTSGN